VSEAQRRVAARGGEAGVQEEGKFEIENPISGLDKVSRPKGLGIVATTTFYLMMETS